MRIYHIKNSEKDGMLTPNHKTVLSQKQTQVVYQNQILKVLTPDNKINLDNVYK